jgi:hypothetical protein
MDDYSMTSLTDSKNEWCARLINILTPVTIQGVKSIFDEAHNLCRENDEMDKYLMTFQTFLSRVPKWNNTIIETERKRIVEASGCTYLEELITCVHVIQLKTLTCVRVGQKQKKVDIDVPSVDDFIHKVYVNVARKIYTNIYLFEKNIAPLQVQKHNRELELIIKECIMNSVRESIPVETILRAYMDEADEHDVEVNEVEEQIPIVEEEVNDVVTEPVVPPEQTIVPLTVTTPVNDSQTRLSFSDIDKAIDVKGVESSVSAPKTIERLESLALQKVKDDYDDDDDDDDERITIGGDVVLDLADVNDLNRPVKILPPPILDDIEILS